MTYRLVHGLYIYIMNFHITRQVGYHAISLVEMEVVLYLEIMTSSMRVFSTDMYLYRVNNNNGIVMPLRRHNTSCYSMTSIHTCLCIHTHTHTRIHFYNRQRTSLYEVLNQLDLPVSTILQTSSKSKCNYYRMPF
jgi:hypothetical protein